MRDTALEKHSDFFRDFRSPAHVPMRDRMACPNDDVCSFRPLRMNSADIECAIEFSRTGYRVDGRVLLRGVDLRIRTGELLVLLGRSGAGKTTALKLVNGLLTPSEGVVRVRGRATSEWNPVRLRRGIGYAIQEVGLMPHLDVEHNVGLVPRLEGWMPDRISARVRELMPLLDLPADLLSRFPHQLSGGQRQRVGLARALAADPSILLMDEPFGALDPLTRVEIQRQFRTLQQRLAKTVVFVTHDVREALFLATRVALLDCGHLVGVYSPGEFLRSPDPLLAEYTDVLRAPGEAEP